MQVVDPKALADLVSLSFSSSAVFFHMDTPWAGIGVRKKGLTKIRVYD
jgi:hypothetical protein